MRGTGQTLAEASDYFYDACELWEDEDLDRDDTIEVLTRAFRSSDCDDYAAVLSRMTGWDIVTMNWQIPDWGFGHHTLVRDPDGRLLDVGGWTDEEALRRHFRIAMQTSVTWREGHFSAGIYGEDDEASELIEAVVRNLPSLPYADPAFQETLETNVRNEDFTS